ncbi:MAG: sulfite exporter TauE/SafE family protein, partial [Deltaproteobacteria bacterium]|nr:sulfite exporter TauE/SafE family protein [Candidatus Tharpellaceae bacterium]
MEYIFVVGLGMVVGILSTVFGLAGGIVMVPGLTVVGISHLEAMASSMGAIVILTSWNAFMYSCKGLVRWSVVFWIAFGAALCSFTAARIAPLLPESWLIMIMMVFLLYIAIRTLMMKTIKAHNPKKPGVRLMPFGIGA